jgi:hypothetical protein
MVAAATFDCSRDGRTRAAASGFGRRGLKFQQDSGNKIADEHSVTGIAEQRGGSTAYVTK